MKDVASCTLLVDTYHACRPRFLYIIDIGATPKCNGHESLQMHHHLKYQLTLDYKPRKLPVWSVHSFRIDPLEY